MDEQKLKEILARLDAPEPQEGKQDQALRAALQAFDKKIVTTPQGFAQNNRLTDINNHVRRFFMNKKYVIRGLVGSVALVALVGVLGVPFFTEQMKQITPPPKSNQTGASVTDKNVSSTGIVDANTVTNNLVSSNSLLSDGVRSVMSAMQGSASESSSVGMPYNTAPVYTPRHSQKNEASQDSMAVNPPALQSAAKAEQQPLREWKETPSSDEKKKSDVAPASAPVFAAEMTAQKAITSMIAPVDDLQQQNYYKDAGRDKFEHVEENPIITTASAPVSTFSIDVDTSSYSFMRRMINQGMLPQKDAVRPEEMINYFPYSYAVPESRDEPFKPTVAVYDAPWKKGDKLLHIGIKGFDISNTEKPHSNLVFLIDTSGSMHREDKLPLVKNALKMLLDTLKPDDTIGIVTYAGSAGTALEPTKVSEKHKIIDALDQLSSAGSTAGAEGIRQAYNLAEAHLDKNGVNRVILATDGDFNVGITDQNELKSFIEREREGGVFLSVLGFGQGNYNDSMMQMLAQSGNGTAAYIDTLSEARKVLVQESSSTLFTIAKDVKIQVEFNPNAVKEYRLIGYETRHLNREDFNNDKVDAGDIGAGHAVTAIYEITPVGVAPVVDDLRYGEKEQTSVVEDKKSSNEYAFLKIRYKLPTENTSRLMTRPITPADDVAFEKTSDDTRFVTAVAGFTSLLKGGKYTGTFSYDQVIEMANGARGNDEFGYRSEFVNLVRLAKSAATLPSQRE